MSDAEIEAEVAKWHKENREAGEPFIINVVDTKDEGELVFVMPRPGDPVPQIQKSEPEMTIGANAPAEDPEAKDQAGGPDPQAEQEPSDDELEKEIEELEQKINKLKKEINNEGK